MSEIQGQEPTPEPQAGNGQPEPEQPKGSAWTLDAAVAEIEKLRKEAAKHRTAANAAEKAKADAEAAALTEQGKFKDLFEKAQARVTALEPLEERMTALTEATKAANEKRVAAIPEGMRGLVPEYDDPFKLAQWLDANSAVFSKPLPPKLDGGAGGAGNGSVTVTDDEVQAFATRFGLDPRYVDRADVAKAYKR